MSVSRLELELIEAAARVDVSIAGRGPQLAIDAVESLTAVSAVQIEFAFQSSDINLAVSGVQVQLALTRHLDDDVDPVVPFDVHDLEIVMRKAHINLNVVAILPLFDSYAVFTDLVARGNDRGFDLVLVPGGYADVGVGGLDLQFGIAGEVVSLGPFVGCGG